LAEGDGFSAFNGIECSAGMPLPVDPSGRLARIEGPMNEGMEGLRDEQFGLREGELSG
jgi:hypothetical protein